MDKWLAFAIGIGGLTVILLAITTYQPPEQQGVPGAPPSPQRITAQEVCEPEDGLEFCTKYTYNAAEVQISAAYYSANPEIKFTTDNSGSPIPYILKGQDFNIRYYVSSTREWAWDGDDGTRTYYKQEGGDLECVWDDGCDGQQLADWESGVIRVPQAGNQYVWIGTHGAYVQHFTVGASAWFYGFEPYYIYDTGNVRIHILNCGENTDCSATQVCDKSGSDPFSWNCADLNCDDNNKCTQDSASDHACVNTPIQNCCNANSDCGVGLCVNSWCLSEPPAPPIIDWGQYNG